MADEKGAEPPPTAATAAATGPMDPAHRYGLHREDCNVAGWGFLTARPRFLVYECFRLPVVSTLWTPDGERPVGRPSEPGPDRPYGTPDPGDPEGELSEEELAQQVAAMRAELANSPVEVVVANHCYGLFELAAVYLSQQPPLLSQARVAIDALGSLVTGLEGRLGEAEEPLKDGLSQLRLAYVQIDGARRAGAEAASAVGVNGESTGGDPSGGDATAGASTHPESTGDTPTDSSG